MRPVNLICRKLSEKERGLVRMLESRRIVSICRHGDYTIIARWGTNKRTLAKLLRKEINNG